MKLYEISTNYLQLLDMADSLDAEVFQDTLSAIEEALEDKVENVAKLVRCLEADIKAIKEEEQRLADRRKAVENKISGIKEYLQSQMEVAGLEKVKRPTITVSIQANPPSINILDESLIPSKFIIPQAPKISKKEILTAIKNGEEVFGVEVAQSRGVRIR
jgi:hypothetical protein